MLCKWCGKECGEGIINKNKSICSLDCGARYMGSLNKGKPKSEEHKRHNVEAHHRSFGTTQCAICGKEVLKYNATQICCKNRECQKKLGSLRYREEKISNPIRAKAKRITGSLRLPKKLEIVAKMILEALENPCEYCGEIISIDNCSLDHKIPRCFSKVYNRKTHRKEYTYEEMVKLDAPGNIHIICRECNQLKSDLNDEQFKIFLKFLSDHPDISKLLKKRLKFGRGRWSNIFIQYHPKIVR
jgi:hypothetical protein